MVHLVTIRLINFGFNRAFDAMKRPNKLLCVVGLLVASSGLAGCSPVGLECEQTVQGVVPSPDGGFVAKVLLVQCGATTADATWVLLTPSDASVGSENDKVAVFEGGTVDASWRAEALNIDFKGSKAFRVERKKHGVSITYNGK